MTGAVIPYFFYLLGAALFTSKSVLTLSIYLCIFSSAFYFYKKYKDVTLEQKKIIYTFVGIYFLAILSNLFSLGRAESAIKTAFIWIWPLFIFVVFYFYTHFDVLKKTLYIASIGLWVSCFKAFWTFIIFFRSPNWTGFNENARIPSFWDVSRWSFFLVLSLIILISYIKSTNFNLLKTWKKNYFYLLFVAAITCLFLSGSRGPWIAIIFGIALLVILNTRSLKKLVTLSLLSVMILAAITFLAKDFKERLYSIVNVKIENGLITSSNISNAGRLHMWMVSADYLSEHPFQPTGFENSEDAYKQFIVEKGDDYRKKYVSSEFSFRDQHSSYLSLVVQFGVIFSIIFFSVIIYNIILFSRIFLLKKGDSFIMACYTLLLTQLFLYSFYSSILSYEAMMLFIPVGVIKFKLLDEIGFK